MLYIQTIGQHVVKFGGYPPNNAEVFLAQKLQRKKILIVDDELDMRIFLCNLLGNCGYEAIEANDRTEGMQKAEKEKPALIILDVMMPKEDGILMYRALKAHKELKHVPVIMVSTINPKMFSFYHKLQMSSRDKALSEPGAYLEKPLQTEKLIQLVRRFTDTDECAITRD
jgi:twitching motility two-component system response regulator PilH